MAAKSHLARQDGATVTWPLLMYRLHVSSLAFKNTSKQRHSMQTRICLRRQNDRPERCRFQTRTSHSQCTVRRFTSMRPRSSVPVLPP